jgi:hypothetical protein
VEGGKGHEFVVAISGVLAGLSGVADDGVLVHAHQAGGLADAAAVVQVREDGQGLGRRQAGAEQGGALALGEAFLAGAAGEQAAAVRSVVEGDAEVAPAAQAVVGAVGVLAAEQVQFVHAGHRNARSRKRWTTPRWDCRKAQRKRQH